MRLHRWMVVLGLLMAGAWTSRAIINLRFTPADLVRPSAQICLIDLQLPGSNNVAGAVTEVLCGEAPAGRSGDHRVEGADGKARTQKVVVINPVRVELAL